MSEPEQVEGAQVIGHEYDGIQEYDNPLPGWWVWMFVATVLFTPLYVVYYHLGQGELVADEYAADLAALREVEAAQAMASGEVNEETLTALMNDAATLAAGEAVYRTNCTACHGELGEGKIGPNLTDEFWLHGGTLVEIHRTIDQGVPDKGMLAWGKTLPPEDVRRVAAWVGSRRGKNVAGLPPQGDKLGM